MSKGVPHYVLHHVAQGQDWPEGDATFHRRILAPTLLVHGLQDPYVTLVQECEMERVSGLMDRSVCILMLKDDSRD
jgi:abhydrolase domain-containing protein 8